MSSPAQKSTANGAEQVEMLQVHQWKCKICKSSHRDEIDTLILNGTRYEDIVKFASEQGLSISESGISRHRNTHTLAPGSADDRLGLEAHAMYARLMRELRGRDFRDLTTPELLVSAQGFGGIILGLRLSSKKMKQPR